METLPFESSVNTDRLYGITSQKKGNLHCRHNEALQSVSTAENVRVRTFKNKRILWLKGKRLQGSGENYIMRSSVVCKGKDKVHPCTGTEALYRPYSP